MNNNINEDSPQFNTLSDIIPTNKNSKKIFKVIRILDPYKIIVNAGKKDGINANDTFLVLDKKGEIIKDTETGEVLGTINESIKANIAVNEIYDRFSICVNKQRYISPLQVKSSYHKSLMDMPHGSAPLNVDINQIKPINRKLSKNPIMLNDPVVKEQ